ncbi:MAG: type III polyketide synthase [Alphaproteobacteria bacterium]|nr:type III polyketide synthase [Alphaproteobacteria bacterium]MCW5741980.1 type III polyketide synthase [Alphaproteobacteria bacterium]
MSERPRLLALSTAVPPYVLDQRDVCVRASRVLGGRLDLEKLLPVFGNAGIERRYSCVPIDWYEQSHGWRERSQLFVDNAVALLERITLDCLDEAGLRREDIDAIVVASTTGIATPSLDALLVERLGLRRDIRRLPIFGLGCAGGVTGLARAVDLAMAAPGSRVLFLVVELCALTFRRDDFDRSNIIAAALFGDGAAGAIVSTEGDGAAFGPAGEHTWPDSLGIMGWDVQDDGLKAIFAQSIPGLVENGLRAVLDDYLARHRRCISSVDGFACHPGGAKVLDALEDSFELQRGALEDSRVTLRDFGNMSAATALFVLQRMKPRLDTQRTLLSALGPGFSASFLMLDGR